MTPEKKNKRITALNGGLRGGEIFLVAAEGTKSRIAFDEKIEDLGFRKLTAGEIEPMIKNKADSPGKEQHLAGLIPHPDDAFGERHTIGEDGQPTIEYIMKDQVFDDANERSE